MKHLRLYVWEDTLADYTAGVMFALASSPEEARDEVRRACGHVPEHELAAEPQCYNKPIGFAVWGGG